MVFRFVGWCDTITLDLHVILLFCYVCGFGGLLWFDCVFWQFTFTLGVYCRVVFCWLILKLGVLGLFVFCFGCETFGLMVSFKFCWTLLIAFGLGFVNFVVVYCFVGCWILFAIGFWFWFCLLFWVVLMCFDFNDYYFAFVCCDWNSFGGFWFNSGVLCWFCFSLFIWILWFVGYTLDLWLLLYLLLWVIVVVCEIGLLDFDLEKFCRFWFKVVILGYIWLLVALFVGLVCIILSLVVLVDWFMLTIVVVV